MKIGNNFLVKEGMSFFFGDRFAFKILGLNNQSDEEGEISLGFEKESGDPTNTFRLKKGESITIGRDKKKNTFAPDGFRYLIHLVR